jgi:hypothetical protein
MASFNPSAPRVLSTDEIDLVGGGAVSEDIIVTARRDGYSGYDFGSLYAFLADQSRRSYGGSFGYPTPSFGTSGVGGPVDSDGDGTPDANDEAPNDANNNTIVVTATGAQVRLALETYIEVVLNADLAAFTAVGPLVGGSIAAGGVTGGAVGATNGAFDGAGIVQNILNARDAYISSRADNLYRERLAEQHTQER